MSDSNPIPHLVVVDDEAAIAFYERAFGATLEDRHPADDGRRLMHAHVKIGNGTLFLHDEFPELGEHRGARSPTRLGGASCVLHLDVPNADAAWERATAAGAEVIMALDNQFWGMRYGQLRDPFGSSLVHRRAAEMSVAAGATARIAAQSWPVSDQGRECP